MDRELAARGTLGVGSSRGLTSGMLRAFGFPGEALVTVSISRQLAAFTLIFWIALALKLIRMNLYLLKFLIQLSVQLLKSSTKEV